MNNLQAILTKSKELKELLSDTLNEFDNIDTLDNEVTENELDASNTMDDVY